MSRTLDAMRKEIESINSELLRVLSQRGALVQEIFALKREEGIDRYDSSREADMLEQLVEQNPGPYPDEIVRRVFGVIFSASLTLSPPPFER